MSLVQPMVATLAVVSGVNEGKGLNTKMRKEIRVKLNGDESRKDASAAFTLPFDTREDWGKAKVPVKVTINGYTWRSTVGNRGGVQYIVAAERSAGLSGLVSGTAKICSSHSISAIVCSASIPPQYLLQGRRGQTASSASCFVVRLNPPARQASRSSRRLRPQPGT
jgi:uncharacterized protein DUF1905